MARGVLAVPVVVASPVQGGVVTATGGTVQPLPWGSDYNSEYQNYVYSATPAQGWTCTGFDVVAVVTLKGSGQQPVTNTLTAHYAGVESGGVWTLDSSQHVGNACGWVYWYEHKTVDSWGYIDSVTVTATFAPVHVPTHLIVNSATVVNPVVPVYDPTSDLLVADF